MHGRTEWDKVSKTGQSRDVSYCIVSFAYPSYKVILAKVLQAPVKFTVNAPATSCQHFYRKIYGILFYSAVDFVNINLYTVYQDTVQPEWLEAGWLVYTG